MIKLFLQNKKSSILALFIGILIGYELSVMYIPDDFERPIYFKVKYLAVKFAGLLAKGCSYLNIGTHASNIRTFLRIYTSIIRTTTDNQLDVFDTHIANIPVRIYSPKDSSLILKPTMAFFHGGAYSFGDLNTYDHYLIEIAKRLKMFIVSVDYRLAPEYPYPNPTNDCYTVTEYLIDNPKEFGIDINRFIIAGDSAGGNAAAVVSQRILNEKKFQAKLTILIYPWLQMFTFHLPSFVRYSSSGIIRATQIELINFVSWYLGFGEINDEIKQNLLVNNHTLLLDDINIRKKLKSYLDFTKIPQEYRNGKDYYDDTKNLYLFPDYELDESNILKSDKNYLKFLENIYNSSVSPLLADEQQLIGLPKTYLIIAEWDALKDEGLLYAERLKSAGVHVEVKYYEKAFHGIASLINYHVGYELAREMLEDLIAFLNVNI